VRVLDEWLLTPQRVAVHLPTAIAVVADLHLGYDEARRLAGEAVPPASIEDQLASLGQALSHNGVRRLAVAGDLLEDGRCREALAAFRAWLTQRGIDLVGVAPGNHDLARGDAMAEAEWLRAGHVCLGQWRVVHGDGPLPRGPVIQGHEHPWVRWPRGPGAPCFLATTQRLILPAYSVDAAGVNVLGVRRWRPFRCCVVAGGEVLDFGPVAGLRRRA